MGKTVVRGGVEMFGGNMPATWHVRRTPCSQISTCLHQRGDAHMNLEWFVALKLTLAMACRLCRPGSAVHC